MSKTIIIDGKKLQKALEALKDSAEMTQAVTNKLVNAATGLISQNVPLILQDLRTVSAEGDGKGEIPLKVVFKVSNMGNKVYIDSAIEWQRTKKHGDSLDLIVIDPDQAELPLEG